MRWPTVKHVNTILQNHFCRSLTKKKNIVRFFYFFSRIAAVNVNDINKSGRLTQWQCMLECFNNEGGVLKYVYTNSKTEKAFLNH